MPENPRFSHFSLQTGDSPWDPKNGHFRPFSGGPRGAPIFGIFPPGGGKMPEKFGYLIILPVGTNVL